MRYALQDFEARGGARPPRISHFPWFPFIYQLLRVEHRARRDGRERQEHDRVVDRRRDADRGFRRSQSRFPFAACRLAAWWSGFEHVRRVAPSRNSGSGSSDDFMNYSLASAGWQVENPRRILQPLPPTTG